MEMEKTRKNIEKLLICEQRCYQFDETISKYRLDQRTFDRLRPAIRNERARVRREQAIPSSDMRRMSTKIDEIASGAVEVDMSK